MAKRIPSKTGGRKLPAKRAGKVTAKAAPTLVRKSRANTSGKTYDLRVDLLEGMITDAFIEENPEVWRTIRIRGDQTLEHFHEAIFKAFDRFDHHLYEFQLGGEVPFDKQARRFVLPMTLAMDPDSGNCAEVGATTIDSLLLRPKTVMFYWFDFGDDWWHCIEVLRIGAVEPKARYPQLIDRGGASPPQYPDLEDEVAD